MSQIGNLEGDGDLHSYSSESADWLHPHLCPHLSHCGCLLPALCPKTGQENANEPFLVELRCPEGVLASSVPQQETRLKVREPGSPSVVVRTPHLLPGALCSKGNALGTLGSARVQEAVFALDAVITSQPWPQGCDLPSPWDKVDSYGLSRETPPALGYF